MLKLFKTIALLEGLSFILMIFLGMPLKYLANNDILIKWLGMPHGILFIAYVLLASMYQVQKRWSLKDFALILFCSFIPFGTFWMDKKYLN